MSNTTNTNTTNTDNLTNTTNIKLPTGGSMIKSANSKALTSKTIFLDQFNTLLSGLENNQVEAEDALSVYYQAQFDLEQIRAATMVNIEQILADMGVAKATVDYKASVVESRTMDTRKAYFEAKTIKEITEMRLANRIAMIKSLAEVIASL